MLCVQAACSLGREDKKQEGDQSLCVLGRLLWQRAQDGLEREAERRRSTQRCWQ